MLALAKILARFFPRAVLPGDGVSGETFDKAFGTKELADLAKVDPLTDTFGMKVRLGTMTTLLPCFDRLQEEMGNVRMKNLLIMHNEQDCRTEFEASKEFVEKVHCDGVVELFNPGGTGHQLFQETLEITQAAIDKAVGFVQNVTARESAAVSTGS